MLGITGLVIPFVPIILSALALRFGYRAKGLDEESQSSRGFWIAGIALGWIGVVLGALYVGWFAYIFQTRVAQPPPF